MTPKQKKSFHAIIQATNGHLKTALDNVQAMRAMAFMSDARQELFETELHIDKAMEFLRDAEGVASDQDDVEKFLDWSGTMKKYRLIAIWSEAVADDYAEEEVVIRRFNHLRRQRPVGLCSLFVYDENGTLIDGSIVNKSPISTRSKLFTYTNEKERSDALAEARHLANEMQKETGDTHEVRHTPTGAAYYVHRYEPE